MTQTKMKCTVPNLKEVSRPLAKLATKIIKGVIPIWKMLKRRMIKNKKNLDKLG